MWAVYFQLVFIICCLFAGLVAHWPLTSYAPLADISGNNLHCKANVYTPWGKKQEPITFIPGPGGQHNGAILFSNSLFHPSTQDISSSLSPLNSFTVALWVNLVVFPSRGDAITLEDNSGKSIFKIQTLYRQKTSFIVEGAEKLSISHPANEKERLYHLAVSYDSATGLLRIFQDGVEKSSTTIQSEKSWVSEEEGAKIVMGRQLPYHKGVQHHTLSSKLTFVSYDLPDYLSKRG